MLLSDVKIIFIKYFSPDAWYNLTKIMIFMISRHQQGVGDTLLARPDWLLKQDTRLKLCSSCLGYHLWGLYFPFKTSHKTHKKSEFPPTQAIQWRGPAQSWIHALAFSAHQLFLCYNDFYSVYVCLQFFFLMMRWCLSTYLQVCNINFW